ncbi:peptidase S8/S53 domain-containing protein [Colletotrichum cereale]|nr:peptidase S8/S53 domain-containing protein [Colletotrichum cereale]
MRSAGLLSWLAVLALSNGALIPPRQSGEGDATPVPYIIVAWLNATKEDIQNINNALVTDAVPDTLTEATNDRTGLAALFLANITSQQADAFAALPGSPPPVQQASVTGSSESPKIATQGQANIGLQENAPEELKIISQAQGASLDSLVGFGYAPDAGRGVTIYTIDSGANSENSEWTGMRGAHQFVYGPGAEQTETDFLNHGTCVASKAAGPVYGTAKNADLVMVKLSSKLTLGQFFITLMQVSNDIYAWGLEGRAVINLSLLMTIPRDEEQSDMVNAFKDLVVFLMANDIVIVTESGDDRESGNGDVDKYPALFGPTTDIVVVGGVYNNGTRASFSQGTGNQLTVSAPAFVTCGSGVSQDAQGFFSTSFAAPTVAGVVAVWLSQDDLKARLQVPGKVAANVKVMLQEMAYPRVEGGDPVVWNGIDPRTRTCQAAAQRRRRQADDNESSDDDGPGDELDCDEPAPPAETSTVPPAETSTVPPADTSTAPPAETSTPVTTTSPSPPGMTTAPPKPTWGLDPAGYLKIYEADGFGAKDYYAISDSASEGVANDSTQGATNGIQKWCLGKCTNDLQCKSVFIYRVVEFSDSTWKENFFCARYNSVWATEYMDKGVVGADSGVAYNTKAP